MGDPRKPIPLESANLPPRTTFITSIAVRQVTDTKPIIRVAPSRYSFCSAWTATDAERMAHDIKMLIERHVVPSFDEFSVDRLDINVEMDETAECSHCGADWVTDDPAYNNGCCDEDVDPKTTSIADLYAWLKRENIETFSYAHPVFRELIRRRYETIEYTIERYRVATNPADLPYASYLVMDRLYADAFQYGGGPNPIPKERWTNGIDVMGMTQDWIAWWDARMAKKNESA